MYRLLIATVTADVSNDSNMIVSLTPPKKILCHKLNALLKTGAPRGTGAELANVSRVLIYAVCSTESWC